MRKSLLVVGVFSIFVSILLYVLKTLGIGELEWVNLYFCLGLAFGLIALEFIFTTIFKSDNLILRKINAYLGVGMLAASLVFFSTYLGLPNYLAIIVSALIIVGLVLIILVFRPKERWDEGDNHKEGYKTYRERIAEEEKAKAKEKKNK